MFILNIIGPTLAATLGASAFTLALRSSNKRRQKVETAPDGTGTSRWNNNCTFGASRHSTEKTLLFP